MTAGPRNKCVTQKTHNVYWVLWCVIYWALLSTLKKLKENKSKRWQTPLADVLFRVSTASHDWALRRLQRSHFTILAKEENQTPLSGYSQISELAHSQTVFVYFMISYWLIFGLRIQMHYTPSAMPNVCYYWIKQHIKQN